MARFEYTVQRSSRRTYSIKVTEDNKIIVRAPARATQRDIENVVAEKRAWIERVLAFNSANVLAGQRVKDYAEAYVRGERVPLAKKEYEIVELLSQNRGQVFDKERIYERCWGWDGEGSSSVVAEHIKRIRAKLMQAGVQGQIETVWGVGYKWVK